MEKFKVGIIGGTGMVGQRFVTLMENHPWFQLTAIAASGRSAGKPYEEALAGRWALDVPMPEEAEKLVVLDSTQRGFIESTNLANLRCLFTVSQKRVMIFISRFLQLKKKSSQVLALHIA